MSIKSVGSGVNSSATSGSDSTFAVAAATLELPKGGGGVRGIGEKFAANPVTGMASLSGIFKI